MDEKIITDYIYKIAQGNSCVDVNLFDEVKELLYSKYGKDFNYVNHHIIEHIDREIEQLNKYQTNLKLKEFEQIALFAFINYILNDATHPLRKHLKDAIIQDSINCVWGDNASQILSINAIMDNIISRFKILELITEDENILIVKSRDRHKIADAIKLLQVVSNDVHLLHHLDKIESQETTTRARILSSSFYQFTKLLDRDFDLNKSQVQSYANDIMMQVFDVTKDYRIYQNTEEFKYKGFYLTRYIP